MERSPKQDFWWRRGSSKGRVALALKTLQFFDKDHLTIIEKSMVNDSIVLLNKIIIKSIYSLSKSFKIMFLHKISLINLNQPFQIQMGARSFLILSGEIKIHFILI